MNPALFRIAAGAALGYFILKKAGKPLHRLAVNTTKGVLDIGGCVAATGNAVYHGWQDIVEEAKTEIEEKRVSRTGENAAGSVMDKVSDNVAGYMHKAAETIENMADRMEYRDNREENPVPSE
ncbi:MAG: hypothetical protein VB084_09405 [Syntrophomonadaceae bacterium]|nr:hypothetical protein [Syntrophomonadaceae bacterium]